MIDFVYHKRVLSIEQVKSDVQFMLQAIVREDSTNVMLQFTENPASSQEHLS